MNHRAKISHCSQRRKFIFWIFSVRYTSSNSPISEIRKSVTASTGPPLMSTTSAMSTSTIPLISLVRNMLLPLSASNGQAFNPPYRLSLFIVFFNRFHKFFFIERRPRNIRKIKFRVRELPQQVIRQPKLSIVRIRRSGSGTSAVSRYSGKTFLCNFLRPEFSTQSCAAFRIAPHDLIAASIADCDLKIQSRIVFRTLHDFLRLSCRSGASADGSPSTRLSCCYHAPS